LEGQQEEGARGSLAEAGLAGSSVLISASEYALKSLSFVEVAEP